MRLALKTALDRIRTKLRNRRAQPLPVTDAGVRELITHVIEGCGLDPANESLQNAIATTLLSLPQGSRTIKINDLIAVVNQARCKQASYSLIEEIRTKDKERRETAKQEADSAVGPQA